MSDEQSPTGLSKSQIIRFSGGFLGLFVLLVLAGLVFGEGDLHGWATGSENDQAALTDDSVQDISWSDKYCCCKAGCPEGSYFCRSMCHILGGTCARKAGDLNGGAATIRNSCMGASYHWWYGLTCPKTCPNKRAM